MIINDYIILGGGIAGLSIMSMLKNKNIMLFEKQSKVGGLCRSYNHNGVSYDIGPHIIFSKNQEVLNKHINMIETNKIKRSNKIVFDGKFIKYPFENGLNKLSKSDNKYCINEFLNNPYEDIVETNMQQFFLKTFGEGITRLYLQPYNEKIWKYDPSCLGTQMVNRIPKPPREDIIKSSKGIETEGFLEQLYFHYPKKNGFQDLVNAYKHIAEQNGEIKTGEKLLKIKKNNNIWSIKTKNGTYKTKKIINCLPIHELLKILSFPTAVSKAISHLKYNSIHIVTVHLKKDMIGNELALYIPQKDIIFHRLTKLNFFGDAYTPGKNKNETMLMADITFRPKSFLSKLTKKEIIEEVINGLEKLKFISKKDVISTKIKTEKYAYVIYDLEHKKNQSIYTNYLNSIGIESLGRFAEFEYMNSDKVVENAINLSKKII